ncbi:MAG: FtsW/RodA/SpoVE family cell cycle protein [Tannerella sp.]|jgi:cell division protein FtsW|nr:FtsW/RodA/SpoVE family cell cycle protein [Tannerella sp.]
MGLASKLFKGDRSIWVIFMLLCFVSLVEVYSATSTLAYKQTYFWGPIVRHGSFLLAGAGLVLLIHNIPNRFFSVGIILLPVSILLLILTPLIGIETNEAHRFLSFMGFTFQPSEFAKLGSIMFTSFILSRKPEMFTKNNKFWIISVGVLVTCGAIVLENFSTAFLLFSVCFLMMFVGQIPIKKLGLLLGVLLLAGILFISSLQILPEKYIPERFATWSLRIENFRKNSNKENAENKYVITTGSDYQEKLAKVAIANGGLFGKLPGRSTQRDYLPQAYSDFIYAIIIEEMGLVFGGIGVLILYIFLMFRVAIIARKCEKQFPKYLALGSGLLIVTQAFINMAVAVNLIPVTGQPLPLISRGGTSTMLTCIYFGIILSVSRFGAGMGNEDETPQIEDVELDEGEELVVDRQHVNNTNMIFDSKL